MSIPAPHFLLFSEARDDSTQKDSNGHWRFVLESVDGETHMEAAAQEQGVQGDRLDLLAVVRGLEALDQPSRVTLLTPSRYINRGFRFGIEDWRKNNWRWEQYGKLAPIKNDDLWRRVDKALQYHRVDCRAWRFDGPHDRDDSENSQMNRSSDETAQKRSPSSGKRSEAKKAMFGRFTAIPTWLRGRLKKRKSFENGSNSTEESANSPTRAGLTEV